MTTTFESARVGDKVWGMQYGWGVVMNVRDDSDYAIEVNFQNGTKDCFTCDGKIYKEHDHQTLFWDEVKIVAPQQPARIKLIHGVEVPDISFTPEYGSRYYLADAYAAELSDEQTVTGVLDKHWASLGLCYPYTEEGKSAAILHAKAMLGIKE